MAKIKILGVGMYAPGEPIDNIELKKIAGIEFDDKKTEEKLGIKKRHIAKLRGIDETTADFATKAAINAIKDADIDPMEVGLFIVGTDTPEFISPATSLIVQGRIQGGEKSSMSFDCSASCASFAVGFDAASRILMSNKNIKYAVVIGVYNMPSFVREKDVFGLSIFADGAGAFVLGRAADNEPSTYIDGEFLTDGTQWNFIGVYAGGTRKPITHDILDKGEYGLQLIQPLPGDRNIKLWPPIAQRLVNKSGFDIKEIDHFIFTQINKSVIVEVMNVLGVDISKTTFVMDRYGYTGSGCVPMAFYHAVKEGKVKRGDKVVFVASGAGLEVGSNLFIY
ncbi:MAG TPA: ketoacyl-ACP synthase III [Spirochaetota bacterium]|nr:ketoacyl-ACP synthase III [Spirochaetota bacterium]HOM38426.1 ketoacyl-ACP synthase III [Spirochaetota bacterium]HPQ48965.1 ketoacyl-ACP synthase III [Spirochaetota bacterium]